MPARRKSSNPCMVPAIGPSDPEETLDAEFLDMEMSEDNQMGRSEPCEASHQNAEGPDQEHFHPETLEKKQSGEEDKQENELPSQPDPEATKRESKDYVCKCCPFWCSNLKDFKAHVDSCHPNVILNPMYHCAVCDFNTKKFELLTEHNKNLHPDENNFKFKRIKKNNQTILEQTIPFEGRPHPEEPSGSDASVFPPCLAAAVKSPDALEGLHRGGPVSIQKDPMAALHVNGTVIIPEPSSVLRDLPHVTPVLQRPPNYNCQPKIAVPLNSSKYNPSLDRNLTLITSFNKFPYPTHAELSWLTAASKHPEQQIKVWFTTQRLKQGITWSPEEVEEARKKMFNGSIPAAHHTFTAPSTSLASPTSAAAPRQAPAQHPLRTAVSSSGTVPFASNVPAGVAASASHALKRSLMAHCGPESKRPVMAVAPSQGDPKEKGFLAPSQKDNHPMAPPAGVAPFTSEMKTSPAVVPLMTSPPSSSSSSKLLSLSGNAKTKPAVSLSSIVFPESLTRPTIAPPPIFAPPFQSSLLPPHLSKDKLADTLPAANVTFPNPPSLVTPQVRRPPIIQSAHTAAKVPAGIPRPEPQNVDEEEVALHAMGFGRGTSATSSKCSSDVPTPTHNNGLAQTGGGKLPLVDSRQKSSVLTHFPLLERMKGKTAEQLKILEEHFLRNSFLSHGDVDLLALATGLSHREISGWFAERRALRDNLELALLNSMGTKRTETDKDATALLKGIHKLSFAAQDRKSGSVPPPRFVPNSCSAVAALPKDHFAQSEGTTPSEVWPGLARVDLARWFCDSRSTLHADFSHSGGAAGLPDKSAASSCQEGGAKVLEAELGWLMEQHASGLSAPQHDELQDRLAGRCE
ncbi:zinc fingers and homeoboxes protein 2-like [Vanacampus margaritifer]